MQQSEAARSLLSSCSGSSAARRLAQSERYWRCVEYQDASSGLFACFLRSVGALRVELTMHRPELRFAGHVSCLAHVYCPTSFVRNKELLRERRAAGNPD